MLVTASDRAMSHERRSQDVDLQTLISGGDKDPARGNVWLKSAGTLAARPANFNWCRKIGHRTHYCEVNTAGLALASGIKF